MTIDNDSPPPFALGAPGATDIYAGLLLSLSALAREFGTTRDTLRRRLVADGVQPASSRGGHPVYRLRDVLHDWLSAPESGYDPDRLDPFKRRAHYQAEVEKLRVAAECGDLIPRMEVEAEMAAVMKILAECFDTLPDILERDCGLKSSVLAKLERCLDKAREELYQRLTTPELEGDD